MSGCFITGFFRPRAFQPVAYIVQISQSYILPHAYMVILKHFSYIGLNMNWSYAIIRFGSRYSTDGNKRLWCTDI